MNQTVANDMMPLLIAKVAAAAGLPPVIDVYSALGGRPDWRVAFPPCGCLPDMKGTANMAPERILPYPGMLHSNLLDGPERASPNMSFTDAVKACMKSQFCTGFSFRSLWHTPD